MSEPLTAEEEAWSDADKLRTLATWFDHFDNRRSIAEYREVQTDLRRIAATLDAARTPALDDSLYPHRGGWRHAKWCEWEGGGESGTCSCGLDALRAALATPPEPVR